MNQLLLSTSCEHSERRVQFKLNLDSSATPPGKTQIASAETNSCTHHDTVALVLAGGKGTRLQPLTQQRCKPAVPFGASYRIIDFTLNNCINSGIRRVGILTQYKQQSLISHIREGWNFLRRESNEFIEVLPARQNGKNHWYEGTADAVRQNIDFLKRVRPRHTLILAGDHIYKADYRRMINHHINTKAEVSIACCKVPAEQAHQFGVVDIDAGNRIVNFIEKPTNIAQENDNLDDVKASMGIYLFNTQVLIQILEQDQHDDQSTHDFGHDIVPKLIEKNDVVAYQFDQFQSEHYWRDVGTIDSYFDTNMQLLSPNPPIALGSKDWPMQTRLEKTFPSHYVNDSSEQQALTSNCIIASGCLLHGARIRRSILFTDVTVCDHSQVDGSLILPGAVVGKRCKIRNTIIDSGTRIEDDTIIGYDACDDAMRYRVSEEGVVIVSKGDNAMSTVKQASKVKNTNKLYPSKTDTGEHV